MEKISFKNYTLSRLCLGTVQFGLDYGISNKTGKPTQSEVDKIIKFLTDNELNCYDTAINYGNSQEVIGTSFEKIDYSPLVISKVLTKEFDKKCEEMIIKSLKELNLDFLFGLLLHDTKLLDSWNKKKQDLVKKLFEKNLIKFFGVSIYTSSDFEKAVNNSEISFIQIPFNLFDQRAIKEKWFEKAKQNGKLLFIRSVFLQGLLLMEEKKIPKNLEKAKKYIQKLEVFSEKVNLSKHEIAFNFVKNMAKDSILLFGCQNLEQAKENIEVFNNTGNLSQSELSELMSLFQDVSEDIYLPTRW